jgi:hypothetical protein
VYCSFCKRHLTTLAEIVRHNEMVARTGERAGYPSPDETHDHAVERAVEYAYGMPDYRPSFLGRRTRALSVAVVGTVIG